MCFDEGILRAYLDGEVDGSDAAAVKRHLGSCARCRTLLERLKEDEVFADRKLAAYLLDAGLRGNQPPAAGRAADGRPGAGRPGGAAPRPGTSHGIKNIKEATSFMGSYRKTLVASVAVLALAASLSFEPVRTFAGDMLNIFRVEKVQVITVSQDDLRAMEQAVRDGVGRVDLADFGRVEFSGKRDLEPVSLDQARASVDFPLLMPGALPAGYTLQEIRKMEAGEAAYTLNADKTNEVLRSLGSTKLLPSELNGKTFTVKSPAVIQAQFAGPEGGRFTVAQSRSPEILVPGGADVGALRDALLSLPFLPDSLRSQLASVDDWQHTFLVPNIEGSSREVGVAGVRGVFITPPAGDGRHRHGGAAQSALIWQKDGVVYAVHGALTLEQALDIASSMK